MSTSNDKRENDAEREAEPEAELDRAARAAAQWRRERPDIDPSTMALFGRLNELSQRTLADHVRPLFAEHGLNGGEFDVLATLRRSGDPYRLSPTALYEATMVTSGAMTGRIDRLEKAGHVERLRDPDDRRGILVALTPAGRGLINCLLPLHVANQQRLVATLTDEERETLSTLLGKVLTNLSDAE